MIVITEELIRQIESHGEKTFPHECGGMLIGHFDAGGEKTVVELLPMENAMDEAERHNRVLILPKDVMKAERYARSKKLDVVGYYHSHPNDQSRAVAVRSGSRAAGLDVYYRLGFGWQSGKRAFVADGKRPLEI